MEVDLGVGPLAQPLDRGVDASQGPLPAGAVGPMGQDPGQVVQRHHVVGLVIRPQHYVQGFDRLGTADRVGFLSNLWAQTRAGNLDPSVVLRTLPVVDGEKDRFVIAQEIAILKSIQDALVGDDVAPAFRRYAALRSA